MAGLTHQERMALAETITRRMAEKYGEDLLVMGIVGSVAREADTPYSDLDMVAVVAEGCEAKSMHLVYRNCAVSLFVMKEEPLRAILMNPCEKWEYYMGLLDSMKLLHGDPLLVKKLLGLGLAVPHKRFLKAIEQLWPDLFIESFGRILSCIERNEFSAFRLSVVEVLYSVKTVLCLLNHSWVKHDYYLGLVDTLKFENQPNGWRESLPFLWNCDDPHKALEVLTPLLQNVRNMLLAEGVELQNHTSPDEIEL